MKAIFLCILFTYIANDAVFGQSYSYKFHYLTVDEGLSHTDANDIVQDKQGYIWIATYFGIDRYDGYAIKKYYNRNVPLNNAFKNRVRCICADETGNIWLSTENGLQCFDSRSEKYIDFDVTKGSTLYFEKLCKPAGDLLFGLAGRQLKLFSISGGSMKEQWLIPPQDVWFSDMTFDQNGLLYLSSNKGMWILDKNKKFTHLSITGVPDQDLSQIYFDNRNNLLTANCNTVFLTKRLPQTSGREPVQQNQLVKSFVITTGRCVRGLIEQGQSDYWISTISDLYRLDTNMNLIQVVNNKSSSQSLNSHSIAKVFIDRSACLWVCTFGGGVNYCDLNEKLFYTLQHTPEFPASLSGNHIRSVLEDGDNLWVGTGGDGLNLYNTKTRTFTYFNSSNSPVKLKSDVITALTFDNDHNLWLGSNDGIQILKNGWKELWKPFGYDEFPAYSIQTIVKDFYGNIWFGNHTDKFGVIWKDPSNHYRVKYYGEGYFIFADKDRPQLFVSGTHGLKQLLIDKEGNVSKTFYYHASSKKNSLSSDYTYPISRQNDSTYWIGTIGGGLNRLTLHKDNSYGINAYTDKDGVFNDVESLEIDNKQNIWIGGNGLESLDPVTGKLTRYDKNDGLQGNSFKVGASFKGADGKLYFGGINGLNYFYPDQIRANSIAAQPVLTDILINNQKPHFGKPDSSGNALSQGIGYGNRLKLNYLQNNFGISFSAMHFANPLKCQYRYKLIGFDKDWKFTDGTNPHAAYSNLDYRDYTFVVEATNNDGVWSKSQAKAEITIMPPWWKTGIAKILYALVILGGLSWIYIYQARWYRLKRELEVRAISEKKKEEIHKQREELHQQQLTFFTNISHEFRTPLTLIMGPLESLINQNKDAIVSNSYQLMLRNARRLLNLISELMNFKKVSDSIIKLQVRPVMIQQLCKDVAAEFESLAVGKGIRFEVMDNTGITGDQSFTALLDIQVLEKILFNLLNNAFKYTDAGGNISFQILLDKDIKDPFYDARFELLKEGARANGFIYFRVADSGIGISSDSITKIFDRYYQVGSNHLGSGIGLALVKSLTQLHKGDIYVSSERYKGTEIIIGIPLGEENYEESEKAASATGMEPRLEAIDNSVIAPLPEQQHAIFFKAAKAQKCILLVDDNEELRAFLKQSFEKDYCIYEAKDGNSAIESAVKNTPDLIISDVMMPGMDGIELCKILKERIETSHIPFIILSAREALTTKIEGMESGADFYFAKPLSIELLLLTVRNVFEQGEKLKRRYIDNYLFEATELVQSEKDKEFIQKLLNLIDDNIQEPEMDVDFLCEHLYISRTKLYQKIKSISDQSVGEFVKTIRLKKAIQIMTHENVSMSEVAFRIGLQSSSDFSRVFKKEYGKSPSQFIQSLKNG